MSDAEFLALFALPAPVATSSDTPDAERVRALKLALLHLGVPHVLGADPDLGKPGHAPLTTWHLSESSVRVTVDDDGEEVHWGVLASPLRTLSVGVDDGTPTLYLHGYRLQGGLPDAWVVD